MPEKDVALELVREDVADGLSAWIEPQSNDHGFAVLRRDEADLDHVLASTVGDAAVPWTWTGVHRGIDGDDDRDVMGYQPTGKTIEVRGVTIVSDRDGGDPTFASRCDVNLAGPDLPETLAPLALVIPAQRAIELLARKLGLDPDAPRGLRKVTQTD